MQMEPQVPLGLESGLRTDSIVAENGGSGVTNSLQDHASAQQPGKLFDFLVRSKIVMCSSTLLSSV